MHHFYFFTYAQGALWIICGLAVQSANTASEVKHPIVQKCPAPANKYLWKPRRLRRPCRKELWLRSSAATRPGFWTSRTKPSTPPSCPWCTWLASEGLRTTPCKWRRNPRSLLWSEPRETSSGTPSAPSPRRWAACGFLSNLAVAPPEWLPFYKAKKTKLRYSIWNYVAIYRQHHF